jgi:glycosyltransferase involved in cell wall biosynthesis
VNTEAVGRRGLRLAVVTETYPPEVNGVARTVERFAEGLLDRGHSIHLVRPRQDDAEDATPPAGMDQTLVRGFPVPRYPQLRVGLPSRGRLARAWVEERPDIVHIATEGPLGWAALAAARQLGIPAATDFHTNFHAYSEHYGFGFLARAVTAYLRHFHNRAACTIVATAELAEELGKLGFARLRVVGRGVDAGTFNPARRSAALRASWGADSATPVALCVSRFAPEKNFPLVLRAFRAMRAACPATRLVLVGDGPMGAALERSGEGCVVAGRLVNGALATHYASADVFLFASTTETFGNVTLEAMASGLAVVAYDYAASRQYLKHGLSALLAARGDEEAFIANAIAAASDLELARELGAQARAVAEQLRWERAVEDFEALMREYAAPSALAGTTRHAAA